MARPIKMMQSYRLPEDLIEAIARIADEDKLDKVDVVINALEEYFAKRERARKKEAQP